MRLPREPYPGLRPFLDFEAALLFGRERQVREVIEGLRQSQFVAVLGGSGSGKSSLIHAGVVPALRSFGIPGAGDLWLPLACTPGTNVSDADRAARRRSPVTRLARRFARLLKSRGSEAADAARLDEIAEVFRQEAGFARLLDAYATELDLPPGPDPEEARVLFVLDQFEEVFHPTNKDVQDAQVLVERVLDHFFNPHPRCHVVLTMRSEHLNDCAAFLELPDAINKSSYLVRRLDPEELREAIVGPAQRFLRLVARSETSSRPLPSQVVFEPAVVQRLLRDVQALSRDPDHLPLLQHLLARLWEAALQREEMDTVVPASITEIDLVRAVNAGGVRGDEVPLAEELNTLRACVNNWPESIYAWHDEAARAQLDALFRHLAFKDPSTGAYSQQRVDVDQAARHLGTGKGRHDLRSLIGEGFLGSVDYLFWDDEDPARVTLKVSHESFIRGWHRFRSMVDVESVQFDEFLRVLRKCADWVANQRSDDYLLETSEMRRLSGSGFVGRLGRSDKWESWSRLLAMDRDAGSLTPVAADMARFVAASEDRLAQRRLRETRGRRTLVAALVLAVGLTLLPTTLFSWLVQGPTMGRAETLFEAGNRANQASLLPPPPAVGSGAPALLSMLGAADLVAQARIGAGPWRTEFSRDLLNKVGHWPYFDDQRDFLDQVFVQAEPPVNGQLRQTLQNAVWRAPLAGSVAAGERDSVSPAVVFPGCTCQVSKPAAGSAPQMTGRLFVQALEGRSQATSRRALFTVTEPDDKQPSQRKLLVYSASYTGADTSGCQASTYACTLGDTVLENPSALDSHVVFDSSLRLFYYTVEEVKSNDRVTTPATLIVQELDWERSDTTGQLFTNRQVRTSVRDKAAVERVKRLAGDARAAVLPTQRLPGARLVDMSYDEERQNGGSGPWWYIANTFAQTLGGIDRPADVLEPLQTADAKSVCGRLSDTFTKVREFKVTALQQGRHCFRVLRGWPEDAEGSNATARPPRDELRVTVHDTPSEATLARAGKFPPAPLAALSPFGRVRPAREGEERSETWFVGRAGSRWDGWLVMESKVKRKSGPEEIRYFGAPWSTCALWRQGYDLLQKNDQLLTTCLPQAVSQTALR